MHPWFECSIFYMLCLALVHSIDLLGHSLLKHTQRSICRCAYTPILGGEFFPIWFCFVFFSFVVKPWKHGILHKFQQLCRVNSGPRLPPSLWGGFHWFWQRNLQGGRRHVKRPTDMRFAPIMWREFGEKLTPKVWVGFEEQVVIGSLSIIIAT